MPYISVHTSKPLNENEKEEIKKELGKLIEILPGKSESVLMVEIAGAQALYFKGENSKPCAFVQVRLWKESPMEAKKELTVKVSEMLENVSGIRKEDIFLNIMEFQNWGSGGVFK